MHTSKFVSLSSARLVLDRTCAIFRMYSFLEVMLTRDSSADASPFLGAQAAEGCS